MICSLLINSIPSHPFGVVTTGQPRANASRILIQVPVQYKIGATLSHAEE